MQKFEYKLLTINASHLSKTNFQSELNAKFRNWGNEGWELVKMEPVLKSGIFSVGSYTSDLLVVFKREKTE